jgi:hypothetical protein
MCGGAALAGGDRLSCNCPWGAGGKFSWLRTGWAAP